MRNTVLGLVHRIAYASLLSLIAWTACTWPYGTSVWQRRVVKSVCYATNLPTAIVGRLTAPYRGMDVMFDRGGEWCDFCSREQEFWYHMRFAVPVYVVLFYIPTLVLWIIRRRRSKAHHEQVAEASQA
jgi:hypothetical protein